MLHICMAFKNVRCLSRYLCIVLVIFTILLLTYVIRKRIKELDKKNKEFGRHLRFPNSSILVLYWTRVFDDTVNITDRPREWPFFSVGKNCPVRCELSSDKSRLKEASALVIHGRNIAETPSGNLKSIPRILHVNENPRYTTSLRDKSVMEKFTYSATYRLDSDFPCPEFKQPNLTKPLPFRQKNGLVMAIYSHCENTRTLYMFRLMKYIEVDSYGKCLRNKPRIPGNHRSDEVKETMRRYKFTLVFPNSDCDYYMTEKISNALSSGTVPVWMGTDKIHEVLQWGNLKHSVIKVQDFASPKALADYLLWLSENEVEYNKFLTWKYEGFGFPMEYYQSPIGQWWEGLPLYCRVCMRLAKDAEEGKGHSGLHVDNCGGKERRTLEKWIRE